MFPHVSPQLFNVFCILSDEILISWGFPSIFLRFLYARETSVFRAQVIHLMVMEAVREKDVELLEQAKRGEGSTSSDLMRVKQ
jgi:hypothetical protein